MCKQQAHSEFNRSTCISASIAASEYTELPQAMYGVDTAHESASTAPDLSWDFIDGLDVNVPITDNFLLPEAAKVAAAKERLKEKNRQAQKRARQKNKVFLKRDSQDCN